MTQEEKAKRYDELLLKLQKAKVDDNVCDEMYYRVIDDIVPELKESEDEKIRKAIHIYFDWLDGRKDYAPKGKYTIRDMIAWLEKQGEQKQDPCEHCADKRLNCHNFPCVKKRAFKQGKSALEVINEEDVDNDNKIEQNPAWSEMDKTMVRLIKSDLELLKKRGDGEVGNAAYQGVINWLKSLKNRVGCEANCTTTKEWSKDDKVMLDDIIDFFENGTVKLQHDLSLYSSWLKSLKDRYAWRASWEQLDALEYHLKHTNENSRLYKETKKLYNDLKKLK